MTIRKITIDDAEYPKNLRNIHTPPKQLYINGALLEQDERAVAIVGARRAAIDGLETAEKLGFELAARGVTVVSGMAIGIDSAGHKGALKAKGRTIAVMGGGHNMIYPPQNKKLYEEIAKTGKAEAARGEHDDLIMAAAIGWDVLRRPLAFRNLSNLPPG